MKATWRRPRRSRWRFPAWSMSHGGRNGEDNGFTLIELITVVAILPLVMGAIAVGLVTVLSQQNTVSNKTSDSAEAQITSTYFVKDAQSAALITTTATPASISTTTVPTPVYSLIGKTTAPVNPGPCGAASPAPILNEQWLKTPTSVFVASYYVIKQGSTTTYNLVRDLCTETVSGTNWSSSAPSINLVARKVQPSLTAPVYGSSCSQFSCSPPCTSTSCSSPGSAPWTGDWVPTAGISSVNLGVQAQSSQFSYSLVAVPRSFNNTSGGQSQQGGVSPLLLLGPGGLSCKGQLNVTGAVTVNSSVSPAISVSGGNGKVTATQVFTPGTISGNIVDQSGQPYNNMPTGNQTANNPFMGLTPPATGLSPAPTGSTYPGSGADYEPPSYTFKVFTSGDLSDGPGIYTFTPNETSSIKIQPGIYIFLNGLTTTGSGGIDGTAGVLFYVYGGQIKLAGGGGFDLNPLPNPPAALPNAPAPNLVVWQDQGDSSNPVFLTGSSSSDLVNGIIYAPTAQFGTSGGGGGSVSALSIIAASMTCPPSGSISLG